MQPITGYTFTVSRSAPFSQAYNFAFSSKAFFRLHPGILYSAAKHNIRNTGRNQKIPSGEAINIKSAVLSASAVIAAKRRRAKLICREAHFLKGAARIVFLCEYTFLFRHTVLSRIYKELSGTSIRTTEKNPSVTVSTQPELVLSQRGPVQAIADAFRKLFGAEAGAGAVTMALLHDPG